MYNGRRKRDVIHVTFPKLGRLKLKEVEDNTFNTKYLHETYGFVRYHKESGLWIFEGHPAWAFPRDSVTTGGRYHVAI